MKVVIPWPDRKLSPNSRAHYRVVAAAKKKARNDAAYLAYDAFPLGVREIRSHFAGEGPISVLMTFYPPDRRHRDDDNMIGMVKAARDGIADALGVNDRRFRPTYVFEEPCAPGRIEIVFSPPLDFSTRRESLENQSVGLEQNEAGQCGNTSPANTNNALEVRNG